MKELLQESVNRFPILKSEGPQAVFKSLQPCAVNFQKTMQFLPLKSCTVNLKMPTFALLVDNPIMAQSTIFLLFSEVRLRRIPPATPASIR